MTIIMTLSQELQVRAFSLAVSCDGDSVHGQVKLKILLVQ